MKGFELQPFNPKVHTGNAYNLILEEYDRNMSSKINNEYHLKNTWKHYSNIILQYWFIVLVQHCNNATINNVSVTFTWGVIILNDQRKIVC